MSTEALQLHKAPQARRQQGMAVLAIGLILLLVLTSIGLLAMRGSALQLKMAGNAMSKARSFERAENTRTIGEPSVDAIADQISAGTSFNCNTAGYYAAPTTLNTANCASSWSLATTPPNWNNSIAGNAADGNSPYVVEYLGQEQIVVSENSLETPNKTTPTHVFRIIARGTDAAGAVSQVESIYMRRVAN